MSRKSQLRDAARAGFEGAINEAEGMLSEAARTSGQAIEESIRTRIKQMVSTVNSSVAGHGNEKFVGVNDDELLTYVPDKRNFDGVGGTLIGILILFLLPGALKYLAIIAFLYAAVQFFFGYVWRSKVDVHEGYEGVVSQFGKPVDEKSHRGRNWLFSIRRFISYKVSMRDQVVDTFNANFTGDYVTVGLGMQIVFRVKDPGKFVSTITPSGAMKLLALYSSYINLRIITSIKDARVKFSGRDNLENVINFLNSNLSDLCGIEVIRVNMPRADNMVLEDLERVRTKLQAIKGLLQTRTVRIEAANKAVESDVRQRRVSSRNQALRLRQSTVKLETHLGQAISRKRQEILMQARQALDTKISQVSSVLASLQANIQKSKDLRSSLDGLRSNWDLRIARLRQMATIKLMPKEVTVLGVDGIGTGVGLAAGPQLFRSLVSSASSNESET